MEDRIKFTIEIVTEDLKLDLSEVSLRELLSNAIGEELNLEEDISFSIELI